MTDLQAQLTLVKTWEEAQAFQKWFANAGEVIAIDTETTGLKWWTPNFLRLVQLGDHEHGWAIPADEWKGLIRMALERYDGTWVGHNLKFDMHALDAADLPVPPRHRLADTKILHTIAHPDKAHGLKRIGEQMFGPDASVGERVLHKAFLKNKWTWATVPVDYDGYWGYAAMDTVLTSRIYQAFHTTSLSEAYLRELDIAYIMYEAERRGLQVDREYTERLAVEWVGEMEDISRKLEAYGITNPNSKFQLFAALRAEFKFEPGEFTETGEPKLDEGILKDLPGEVAPMVLRFRRLRKWSSAYLQHFLTEQDGAGRIHASINTLAARTGRMSITSPPLQTLPRGTEIRDCIVGREGTKLLDVDYDTVELRLLASFAEEQGLIDAFLAGKDLHRYAAASAYQKSEAAVSDYERQIAKHTQYALIYGAGPVKIAWRAGVSIDEANHFIEAYHEAFPRVGAFMEQLQLVGKDRTASDGAGYVISTGGRKIIVDAGYEYRLVNYLIQGSAADVFKEKLVSLDNAGLTEYLLLPVHDSVLFEIPVDDFKEYRQEILGTMLEERFAVPLTVHASEALERWGDAYR